MNKGRENYMANYYAYNSLEKNTVCSTGATLTVKSLTSLYDSMVEEPLYKPFTGFDVLSDSAIYPITTMENKTKFKVGDRVRAIGRVDGQDLKGKEGTVVSTVYSTVSVDFDENIDGHDCCGKAKINHGRNGEDNEFELINNISISIFTKMNNFFKKLADPKVIELTKAGYMNGDLKPTMKGLEALQEILFFANYEALVAQATAENKEKEEKEKSAK